MSPPTDDASEPGTATDDHRERRPQSPVEFEPPTDETTGDATRRAGAENEGGNAETTSESLRRTLDGVLPEADVDSNWWYWIAAVPLYFVVTLVGGAVAAVVFVFTGLLDAAGLGGVASASTFVLLGGVGALVGLVGVVLAFVFPVAVYVDARAVEALDGGWTPDPVLWGLLAVVAVLVTNFVVSVPLAVYYLYRRHEELGTP